MFGHEFYYMGQIQLSDHIHNKKIALKNVVFSSSEAISSDILQAYMRDHLIQNIEKELYYPITTTDIQIAENKLRYTKKDEKLSDDMIPFVEFSITSIPFIEFNAQKQNSTLIHIDLSFINNFIATKFADNSVRVTAMLKPSFHIFKDGLVADRIFSIHKINGSVSSITMTSHIKKVGLSDFAKIQSLIAHRANEDECLTIWGQEHISEVLYGESARSFAQA